MLSRKRSFEDFTLSFTNSFLLVGNHRQSIRCYVLYALLHNSQRNEPLGKHQQLMVIWVVKVASYLVDD